MPRALIRAAYSDAEGSMWGRAEPPALEASRLKYTASGRRAAAYFAAASRPLLGRYHVPSTRRKRGWAIRGATQSVVTSPRSIMDTPISGGSPSEARGQLPPAPDWPALNNKGQHSI